MQYFETAWHPISAMFVLCMGFIIMVSLRFHFAISFKRASALYFWHTLFCVVYVWYALGNVSDSISYYNQLTQEYPKPGVGSSGVLTIAAPFFYLLDLSFLGICLVFNIFGAIGLMAFDASLRGAVFNKGLFLKLLATGIVFLPSISFWSSALGKDALAFMATNLALWATLNFKKRIWLMILSIIVMFVVRPHVAGFMVIALAASLVIHARISLLQRLILGVISVSAAAVVIPFALQYAGLNESADAEAVLAYIEGRQFVNSGGGSSIDIASMSLPMKMFTYLFRPLPFEVGSIFQFAASLDNVILLFLFFVGGFAMLKGRKSQLGENRIYLWVFSLLMLLILSMTTANLGISVRQKWMFAPLLIFLFISVMGKSRTMQPIGSNSKISLEKTYAVSGFSYRRQSRGK